MDYYNCRNCGWYFTREKHKNLKHCPNCKEPYYMQLIDKTMYHEWLNVYHYSNLYKEWQQDKYFDTMWKMCNMIWGYYADQHNGL